MVTNIPKDFDKLMDKKVEYKASRSTKMLFNEENNHDFHPF